MSCAETITMLQKAYEDESVGKTEIKDYYMQLKNDRTSVDSDPRSGLISLSWNTENNRKENFNSEFWNYPRVYEINSKGAYCRAENVIKKNVTGDESWVFGYDPRINEQSW